MNSKKISALIISILFVVYTIRVITINKNFSSPENEYYYIGDSVPIENNFFDTSDEKMDGYSLTVLDTTLMSMDEFNEKYVNIEDVHNKPCNYVYLVRILFKNTSNDMGNEAGIDLMQYILQESAYTTLVETSYFKYLNDFDALKFALRENSEKEIVVPFRIITQNVDINQIKNGCPTLVVSLYPHKKIIKLND